MRSDAAVLFQGSLELLKISPIFNKDEISQSNVFSYHWSWFVSIISQILNDILGSSYSFSSIIFLNNIVYLTLFIQVSCFRDLNKISWIYHQINIIWNFLAKCGFLTGCLGNSFISWLNAILREFWVSIFHKILNGWWQIYERPYSVA